MPSLSLALSSLVPRLSWGRGKREPGNHCMRIRMRQSYQQNMVPRLCFVGRIGACACSGYQALFSPSPKRAWGQGYRTEIHADHIVSSGSPHNNVMHFSSIIWHHYTFVRLCVCWGGGGNSGRSLEAIRLQLKTYFFFWKAAAGRYISESANTVSKCASSTLKEALLYTLKVY